MSVILMMNQTRAAGNSVKGRVIKSISECTPYFMMTQTMKGQLPFQLLLRSQFLFQCLSCRLLSNSMRNPFPCVMKTPVFLFLRSHVFQSMRFILALLIMVFMCQFFETLNLRRPSREVLAAARWAAVLMFYQTSAIRHVHSLQIKNLSLQTASVSFHRFLRDKRKTAPIRFFPVFFPRQEKNRSINLKEVLRRNLKILT